MIGGAGLPTGTAGRWTALGLLVVAAGLLWLGVADPLLGWYQSRAEALEQRATLASRMAGLAATLPELERAAANKPAGPRVEALFPQTSDAVASAALLELVQATAAKAGAPLSSTEILPADTMGDFRRIKLRIAFSAPLAATVALLQTLGGTSPRLFVDELQLRAAPVLVGRDTPPLDASMLVLAFRAVRPP